jgi:CheY-like chemotaxis protein
MDKKLLIIDDTDELVNVVRELLSNVFTEIISSSTVEDALKKINDQQFSCVILDINLEGRNGAEIVKFLKDNPKNLNKDVPIIIMSGIINAQFIEKNQARFAGILTKPFEHNDLHKMVSEILRANQLV